MSFAPREESREHGEPINVMLFRYGAAEIATYAYTDKEQSFLFRIPGTETDITAQPIPLSIAAVTASGTLDRKTLKVLLPQQTDIAQQFASYPPSYTITMVMYQGHLTDDDSPIEFLATWAGRVLNGRRTDDNECELSCEPVATSLRRAGLRRKFQFMCPHVLYGPKCKANRPAATISVTPALVGGNYIHLTPGWNGAFPLNKFQGGVIEWTVPIGLEIRAVLDIEPNVGGVDILHMAGSTKDLEGQAVRISLGCNHAYSLTLSEVDCIQLHNNIANFGGDPFIPTDNPVGTFVNVFY